MHVGGYRYPIPHSSEVVIAVSNPAPKSDDEGLPSGITSVCLLKPVFTKREA